jgi:hypothetical protein
MRILAAVSIQWRQSPFMHDGEMRIESPEGQQVASAYLWLSRAEASELRDALNDMLAAAPDPSWHAHVAASNYTGELSVAWETK